MHSGLAATLAAVPLRPAMLRTLPYPPPPNAQVLLAALAGLYAATFTTLLLQGPSLLGAGGVDPAGAHLKLTAEQLTGSADYSRCVVLAFRAPSRTVID